MRYRGVFCVLVLAGFLALAGCGAPAEQAAPDHEAAPPAPAASASPNQTLLDELGAAESWFHAKKTRPIWARQAEEDQTLTTIEGEETVSAGDYICRGEAGDMWPQKEERLLSKYQVTETVDEEGWRLYTPNPDSTGVMAAQVDHAFTVEATWGTLSGKPGDFAVKNYEDRDVAYPEDVWIVDQALFHATYAAVERDQGAPGG
ncbi:MAG: hypothetical protein GY719_13915 [bacterium]|nr:hypothetical protein [bacterium]